MIKLYAKHRLSPKCPLDLSRQRETVPLFSAGVLRHQIRNINFHHLVCSEFVWQICFTTMRTNWWDWALKSAGGLCFRQTHAGYQIKKILQYSFILKDPHHYQAWTGVRMCLYFEESNLFLTKCLVLIYETEKIYNFTLCLERWEHKMQKNSLEVRWGPSMPKNHVLLSHAGPEGGFPAFDNGESHHA